MSTDREKLDLAELVLLSLEGSLSEDQHRLLNESLQEDKDLRSHYFNLISIHVGLNVVGSSSTHFHSSRMKRKSNNNEIASDARDAGLQTDHVSNQCGIHCSVEPFQNDVYRQVIEKDLSDTALRQLALEEAEQATDNSPQRQRVPRGLTSSVFSRFLVRAAAVILVAVSLIWLDHQFWKHIGWPEDQLIVATLIKGQNVVWADPYTPTSVNSPLRAGSVVLDNGVAQLQMTGGTKVIIEGPAHFTLDTPDRIRLDKGAITAVVPPEAVGFTINAPGTEVIDLGTEFGVRAKGRSTEIQVFDGEVEAFFKPIDSSEPSQSRRFRKNDRVEYYPEHDRLTQGRIDDSFIRRWADLRYRIEMTGPIVRFEERPVSLQRNANEIIDDVRILEEKRGVLLEHSIDVSIVDSGRHVIRFKPNKPFRTTLRGPMYLDSYLLHIDRPEKEVDSKGDFKGSLTFYSKIAAVICTREQLNQTDNLFGREDIAYEKKSSARGIYEWEDDSELVISSDRKTLRFSLQTKDYDQVRILVHSPK